jgi:signal peptidase I
MSQSSFHAACRLVVGVCVVTLVTHTWLVMGLVVPVTVAGSSMAPTLRGPQRIYRCGQCRLEFPVALDPGTGEPVAVCPQCGRTAVKAVVDRRGDRLIIDRTAFAFRQPRRWDLVVFRSPEDARQLCVKRVVGLPGETVALVDGGVLINGKLMPHPRGITYEIRCGDNTKMQHGWQLGPGEYFVLGDNAAISDDSRSWFAGPGLDAKLLIGRPLGVR